MCPGCDRGSGRRRWRALDLGTVTVEIEADVPRVECPERGVLVAAVPWARPNSGFTRDFEQQCLWPTVTMQNNRLAAFLRVAWRTVDAIITRVVAELSGSTDRLDGLRRIQPEGVPPVQPGAHRVHGVPVGEVLQVLEHHDRR